MYNYGARFYDPVVARFTSVDKEAERYEGYSPFSYVLNRPTVAIDPDGNRIYFIGGANNDQDGWNYIQRWQMAFHNNGINNFVRLNESHGKSEDVAFTARYRESGYETVTKPYPMTNYVAGLAPSPVEYTSESRPVENSTINKTVEDYQADLKNHPLKKDEQFNLVGYSYGSVLQAQVALKLANSGQTIDNLVLIGSPISDKSELYNQLSNNKNIRNILRFDLKNDALSNPQDVYDFLKGAGQGLLQGDKAHHFDAARPGHQADMIIDTIVRWLKMQGVKD